ncbi:MAG: HD domain-containing protein, partial [Acholeplasmatales bacterium]|nr:HD domain-containing protein [Acholeplasmatales bacterium]
YVSRIDPTVPFNIDLYKEVLKQKVHYSEIENPKVIADIFVGYFNVVVASESIPCISPIDSYNYLLEAEELYNSDEFKKVDSDNEDIKGMMEEIRQGFLVFAGRYNELTDEIKEFIYERSLFYISKDDLYKSPLLPFLAYNRCLYEKGIITKDEILKRCDMYFKPMIEEFGKKEIVDEDIATAFEAMSLVLDILSLDGEADINHYYNLMKKFFKMADARKFAKITPYINSLLADFVLKSLPFEHDKEEIEQSLFDNLIKTQAPTYIHSVMVMKIAELIYNYMDKSLLPKLDNPHEFITNSALLHDIGKSKITAIINLQRRKLSNFEFTGIKNHPAFGIDIINKNKLLTEYHDVIIGHHKSYDGKSGYPKDFDNTKSEYKIIIDLITIADCLDAATDKYGRNYKHPKSVKDVILEFEAGSGTLYNPYFVNLLKNNKDLITKLEDLTELKRPEYMYKAYIKTGIFD